MESTERQSTIQDRVRTQTGAEKTKEASLLEFSDSTGSEFVKTSVKMEQLCHSIPRVPMLCSKGGHVLAYARIVMYYHALQTEEL